MKYILSGILLCWLGYSMVRFHHKEVTLLKTEMSCQELESKLKSDSIEVLRKQIDSLSRRPKLKRKAFNFGALPSRGTYFGFEIRGRVDTFGVSDRLKTALLSYDGPKTFVNSLRRPYSFGSKHQIGRAIDLHFCPVVIDYLTSIAGRKWLERFGITFYIEGRPGSSLVKQYEYFDDTKDFVFYNKNASGDHLHLSL